MPFSPQYTACGGPFVGSWMTTSSIQSPQATSPFTVLSWVRLVGARPASASKRASSHWSLIASFILALCTGCWKLAPCQGGHCTSCLLNCARAQLQLVDQPRSVASS
jgi:hypothetical protein